MEWNKLEPAIIKIRGGLLNVFEDIEKKQDSILPAKNEEIDTFVEDCNLFAVFDAPVNVLFSKNLIVNK